MGCLQTDGYSKLSDWDDVPESNEVDRGELLFLDGDGDFEKAIAFEIGVIAFTAFVAFVIVAVYLLLNQRPQPTPFDWIQQQ
jgi:O-antigen ligase